MLTSEVQDPWHSWHAGPDVFLPAHIYSFECSATGGTWLYGQVRKGPRGNSLVSVSAAPRRLLFSFDRNTGFLLSPPLLPLDILLPFVCTSICFISGADHSTFPQRTCRCSLKGGKHSFGIFPLALNFISTVVSGAHASTHTYPLYSLAWQEEMIYICVLQLNAKQRKYLRFACKEFL